MASHVHERNMEADKDNWLALNCKVEGCGVTPSWDGWSGYQTAIVDIIAHGLPNHEARLAAITKEQPLLARALVGAYLAWQKKVSGE